MERIHERRVISALWRVASRYIFILSALSGSPSPISLDRWPARPAPTSPHCAFAPLCHLFAGCSPLFVTAVSPVSIVLAFPLLRTSLPSGPHPHLSPLAAIVAVVPSFPCRLRYVSRYDSVVPPWFPVYFWTRTRRNGSTTPFVPELGRVRMRRLTSTEENRDWSSFYQPRFRQARP